MGEREKPIPFANEIERELESPEKDELSSSLDDIEKEVAVFREAIIRGDFADRSTQEGKITKLMEEYRQRTQKINNTDIRNKKLCEYISLLSKLEITSDINKVGAGELAEKFFIEVQVALQNLGEEKTPASIAFLEKMHAQLGERLKNNEVYGNDFISVKWLEKNFDEVNYSVFDELLACIIKVISSYKHENERIQELFLEPTDQSAWRSGEVDDVTKIEKSRIEAMGGGEKYFRELDREIITFGLQRTALLGAVEKKFLPREAVDIIMEWLQRDETSYHYRQGIAGVLNKTDAEYAKNKLLVLVSDPPNPHIRELAVNLLFRLELGEVPITEDGLNYLNKKYNLGEYNQKGNVARRLTTDGTVGVFDKDRSLAVCFEAASPDAPEEKITPKLSKVSVSDLFFPRPNETDEERAARERALETFTKEYFRVYQTDLFNKTDFYFSDLSLKEQGAFLLLCEKLGGDGVEYKRLIRLTRDHGEDAFRSLLALQYEPEIFGAIANISEKAPSEIAEKFFKKISEITQAAYQVGDYLRDTYGQDEASAFKIAVITERLMQRAAGLIKDWGKDPQAIGAGELRELDRVKAGIILFAAAFKEVSKGKKIDLAEVAETSLENVEGKNITADDRLKMKEIFNNNWRMYSEKIWNKIRKSFEFSLEGDSKFYILRRDEDIVGFLRFEETPRNTLYAGSFNILPEVKDSSIGSALFDRAIEREGATRTIEAVVHDKHPMLRHYINGFGFKIVGEIPNYEGTGERFYKIERPPTRATEQAELREAA
jgi:ribosomal protein S18 acetylase RimI-like enzyme